MRKKLQLLILTAALLPLATIVSCSGKGEEEVKTLSAESVKMSGEHKNLIQINGDEVKIMLVNSNPNDKYGWEIRASMPIIGTTAWSDVPGTDESASSYFSPRMGNLSVAFLDANGNELEYAIAPNWDAVETVLKNAPTEEEDLICSGYSSLDYKGAKAFYDKIQGLRISKMDLNEVHTSTSSSSSVSKSSSWDDVDLDDDLEDVKKAIKAEKKILEAYSDAMDACYDLF